MDFGRTISCDFICFTVFFFGGYGRNIFGYNFFGKFLSRQLCDVFDRRSFIFGGLLFDMEKMLVPDWLGFNGKFWMWKVTYVIIALAALGAILVAGVIVEFINTGLAGIIKPEWTTWGFVAFPLYIVFVAIIEVCGGIKKRKI